MRGNNLLTKDGWPRRTAWLFKDITQGYLITTKFPDHTHTVITAVLLFHRGTLFYKTIVEQYWRHISF